MNWTLVTYADEKFLSKQKFLIDYAEKNKIKTISYNQEWLKNTSFYKENENILKEHDGVGYFLWKPYIILDALNVVDEGELLFYCDCGDIFHPDIVKFVNSIIEDDFCLLSLGGFPNKDWTKRDCFVLMDCDEKDYWESTQLESGISFWKSCEQSKKIVNEWLEFCKDRRIVSDDDNVCGKENFPSFKSHRRDQSILTNLAIKYGLPVVGSELRNYIECNYDYWYEKNSKNGFTLGRPVDQLLISLREELNA